MNETLVPWLISALILAAGLLPGPALAGQDAPAALAGLDDPPALEGPVELMQDDDPAPAPADVRKDTPPAQVDWRKDGPPADRPAEKVDPAPGADYFYVAGHYAPDGDGVAWKPGFWAQAQPGWEWVPAHWVRQPSGWAFKEGRWDRIGSDRGPKPEATPPLRNRILISEPLSPGVPPADRVESPPMRHTAARPAGSTPGLPGAITPDLEPDPNPAGLNDLRPLTAEDLAKRGSLGDAGAIPRTAEEPTPFRPGASRPPVRPGSIQPYGPEDDRPPVSARRTPGGVPDPTRPGPDDLPERDPRRPLADGPPPPGFDYPPPYPPPGYGIDPFGRPDPRGYPRYGRRGPLAPLRPILREIRGFIR